MLDLDCQILKILSRNNGKARLKTIQENIKLKRGTRVPLSTINSCIERLEKSGYVNWVRYSPVNLTEQGENLANELLRHAQLLEVLLFNELDISAKDAHSESEKLNLLLSCDIINKICEKYGHPSKCPCGDAILSSPTCFCEAEETKLN